MDSQKGNQDVDNNKKSSAFIFKETFNNPNAQGVRSLNAPYLTKKQLGSSYDFRNNASKYLQTTDPRYTQLVNIKKLLRKQKQANRQLNYLSPQPTDQLPP